jgi:lysophospholipase L1-like esterase
MRSRVRSRVGRPGAFLMLASLLVTCSSGAAFSISGDDPGQVPRFADRGAGPVSDLGALAPHRLPRTLTEAFGRVDSTSAPAAAPQQSPTPWPNDVAGDPAASTDPVSTPRGFVVLGDSLSVWAFAPGSRSGSSAGAWPSLLADRDPDLVLLHNAGVPGNTTAEMLARLKRDVLRYHPDVLFVLGGTNDLAQHFAASVTLGNIRKIVETARSHGITVVLLTIPPSNVLYKYEQKWLRQVNAAIVRLGEAEGIAVVDTYSALATPSGRLPSAYVAADRLHLSQRGEEVVAATVRSLLTAPPLDPFR